MGISRQCAHRWVARFDAEGDAGSARPVVAAASDADDDRAEIEAVVLAARVEHRRGQDWLGPELGVAGPDREPDPAPPPGPAPGGL